MRKTFGVWLAIVCLTAVVDAQPPQVVTALKGFDPVELVDNREVKGSEDFSATRGKYRYFFANEANRKRFEKSPTEYQIQLGGGCGRMGSLSGEGDPDRYHVFNRRIYIFASEQCRNSFKAAPENHLEAPDPTPTGSAADKKRAQELLKLALDGVGGTTRVDAIKNYQARIRLAYKQGDKTTGYKQTESIAFPNFYRNETDWGSATEVNLLSPGGAITIYKSEAWVREEPVRAALEREFHHSPLTILKARRNPGFVAFAAGKGKAGETDVELVKVAVKGATTTLGIDPRTGRILQTSYRGRKSAFGEIVKSFSDFREVDGLILPFRVEESFNGKPITNPVVTYDSVAVNGKLDENLFRKPQSSSEPAPQQQQGQPKTETKSPQFDNEQYQFGLLSRGPKWTAENNPEIQKIQEGHMANINKMAQAGKLFAAGPILDNGDLRGIFIFRAASVDEAKALAAEDPAIKAERLKLEILPWFGSKGIGVKAMEEHKKNPDMKWTMKKHHLVLLKSGAQTAHPAPEAQRIQLDHLWHIRRMMDEGKMLAAGPFMKDGALRGIFVFNTESPEEAKSWAEADPAVKAGRLTIEIHPWLVAKEVWP